MVSRCRESEEQKIERAVEQAVAGSMHYLALRLAGAANMLLRAARAIDARASGVSAAVGQSRQDAACLIAQAIEETRPRTVSYAELAASDQEIADDRARDELLERVRECLAFDAGLAAEVEALA